MEMVISGFPNYRINRNGEVFSNYKYKTNRVSDTWRPVKHVLDSGTGYLVVTLVNDGIRKNQAIHRLLAQHFIPNPENKAHVNHIDGDKQNNCLSNLEWSTPQENAAHAVRIGLCDNRTQSQSLAVAQLDRESGEVIAEYPSLHEAGRATGIAWQNIWKVCDGRRMTAGGYFWKYI